MQHLLVMPHALYLIHATPTHPPWFVWQLSYSPPYPSWLKLPPTHTQPSWHLLCTPMQASQSMQHLLHITIHNFWPTPQHTFSLRSKYLCSWLPWICNFLLPTHWLSPCKHATNKLNGGNWKEFEGRREWGRKIYKYKRCLPNLVRCDCRCHCFYIPFIWSEHHILNIANRDHLQGLILRFIL